MDANSIMTMVGSLGFPIVMCIYMLKHIKEQDARYDAQIKTLTDTVNNNTLVVQRLCDRLSQGGIE